MAVCRRLRLTADSVNLFQLCLLTLLATACARVEYGQRARSPLQEMRSVVHQKSQDFDVPPKVLSGMRPEYPEPEGARRQHGFAVIICTVGIDGRARDFEVETMTSPAFAYEAMRAIEKWQWAPARKNGHPVPQKVRVPMTFRA